MYMSAMSTGENGRVMPGAWDGSDDKTVESSQALEPEIQPAQAQHATAIAESEVLAHSRPHRQESKPSTDDDPAPLTSSNVGRLKDLEGKLRNLNCLASCPRRLGLWVFSPTPNFESLNSVYIKNENEGSKKILVDTTILKGMIVDIRESH